MAPFIIIGTALLAVTNGSRSSMCRCEDLAVRRRQTLRVPGGLIRDGLHDALNFLAYELSQRPDIHQRDAATLEAN